MNNTTTAAAVEAKSVLVVCMAPQFLVALLSWSERAGGQRVGKHREVLMRVQLV